jgi:hypothetical protein
MPPLYGVSTFDPRGVHHPAAHARQIPPALLLQAGECVNHGVV